MITYIYKYILQYFNIFNVKINKKTGTNNDTKLLKVVRYFLKHLF